MDWLAQALATEGLVWLAFAAFLAGIVRGFSGFGTAMIYLPVASQFLTPFEALITLMVMDFFGPLPLPRRPRSQRRSAPRPDRARPPSGSRSPRLDPPPEEESILAEVTTPAIGRATGSRERPRNSTR